MLLLERYTSTYICISNFTRARYYYLSAEFGDFYVNQSLAGQTILKFVLSPLKVTFINQLIKIIIYI
jgi:hypothetical protein